MFSENDYKAERLGAPPQGSDAFVIRRTLMFKNFLMLAGAAVCWLLSGPAFAEMGSVNFTGEITASACSISSNSLHQVVDLGTKSVGELRKSPYGKVSQFSIRLTDCHSGAVASIRLTDPNHGSSKQTGLVVPETEGNAKGMNVVIRLNAQGRGGSAAMYHVDFSKGSAVYGQNYARIDWESQTREFFFDAYMHAYDVARVTPGKVSAQMDYTVEYK